MNLIHWKHPKFHRNSVEKGECKTHSKGQIHQSFFRCCGTFVLQIKSDEVNEVLGSFLGYSRAIYSIQKNQILITQGRYLKYKVFSCYCAFSLFSHYAAPPLNGCKTQDRCSEFAGSFLREIASWLQGNIILMYQQNTESHHMWISWSLDRND